MSLEKIISSIPEKTAQERAQMRENAKRLVESGTSQQQEQARQLLDALDAQEEAEHKALYEKLAGMPAAERVVEAFRALPPTETDIKVIRALIENPGSTSTELSQALGWGGKSWHMHFGKMCEAREAYLWPAERFEKKDASFYSGILADFSADGSLFTMKPDVAAAFEELGFAKVKT